MPPTYCGSYLNPRIQRDRTQRVDQVRLFRNRPDVRWEYRIHEQILLSIRRTGAILRSTEVVIDHHGYDDPDLRQRKLHRNNAAVGKSLTPKSLKIRSSLSTWPGFTRRAGKLTEALLLLEMCKKRLLPQVTIVPKVYRMLGQILDRLERTSEALEGIHRRPSILAARC